MMVILLLTLVCMAASCILDPKKEEIDDVVIKPRDFKPLTEKDHILYNLEILYNSFDKDQYDKLLDANLTFFFSDADFSNGTTPEQWERDRELAFYQNFFDPQSESPVKDRSLKLTYSQDNWTEIVPDDQVMFPDESWYHTTVTYDMSVVLDQVPELTLIANGLKADIIVRWDETREHYRMVRWRDDTGN
jgi:hypothetical protein